MNKVIFASMLALLGGAAHAADAVVAQEPAPVSELAPTFVWTGGYVGLQGGYAAIQSDFVSSGNEVFTASPDIDAVALGGHAGFRYQFGNGAVVGLEADANWLSGDTTEAYAGTAVNVEANWDASLRATAGYAFDRFLPYVTAGVAFLDFDLRPDVEGNPDATWGDTATGWTVGAGVAYAFTDSLIGQIEYRYSDYGSSTFDTTGVVAEEATVDLASHKVSIGLSYKF